MLGESGRFWPELGQVGKTSTNSGSMSAMVGRSWSALARIRTMRSILARARPFRGECGQCVWLEIDRGWASLDDANSTPTLCVSFSKLTKSSQHNSAHLDHRSDAMLRCATPLPVQVSFVFTCIWLRLPGGLHVSWGSKPSSWPSPHVDIARVKTCDFGRSEHIFFHAAPPCKYTQ